MEINTILAKRYGKSPALLMWHVSNEYSGECYCNLCQQNWREWLQKKYGNLDKLNKAWYLSVWSGLYSDWDQVLPPSPLGETKVHGMDLDWKRFVTDMTINFFNSEIKPLREITPNIPVTTNFMAEGQDKHQFIPFTGLNYQKFGKAVDIVSWDSYPDWHNRYETTVQTAMKAAYIHDQYWSLKHQPFLVMESTPSTSQFNKAKRPGMHILSSLQQIAHGSDSSLYFQIRQARGNSEKLHGAVIGHDGSSDNRVYQEVAKYGDLLGHIGEIQGATKRVRVALVFDWESNWALNRAGAFDRPTRYGIQTLQKHYATFWKQDITCDIVSPSDNLSGYDLVIAPMLYMLRSEGMKKLQGYVKNGGTLVASYETAMVDEYDRMNIGGFPDSMARLFGIQTKELDTLLPGEQYSVEFANQTFKTHGYDEVIKPTTAQMLGNYQNNFYEGTAAVTRNHYGKGNAYYIAARMDQNFVDTFYKPVIEQLHLRNTFIAKSVPEVSCQTRYKSGNAYHFLMNFSEVEQTVITARNSTDMITGTEIVGRIVLPKYGVKILKEQL